MSLRMLLRIEFVKHNGVITSLMVQLARLNMVMVKRDGREVGFQSSLWFKVGVKVRINVRFEVKLE